MRLAIFTDMLHKLRVVEQKLTKTFEDEMGFSLTRYEILVFLKEQGEKLQVEIADYMHIDPAAVTRHIKILETKGYINKKRNEKNAREVIISLTDFAHEELAKCSQNHKENEESIPFAFSEEEILNLIEMLDNVNKKLK